MSHIFRGRAFIALIVSSIAWVPVQADDALEQIGRLDRGNRQAVGHSPPNDPSQAALTTVIPIRLRGQNPGGTADQGASTVVPGNAGEPGRLDQGRTFETSAEAQPGGASTPAPAPDLQTILKRLDVLEKARADAAAKKPEEGWVDVSKEGWTVRLGGHVQLDYVLFPNADPKIRDATNYFNYRRLRLVADGTGYGVFDFRLQMTLEPGEGPVTPFSSPDVKDAYLSMNEIPILGRFRVGNFFVPFSLEQVTNDTNNIFLERSIPTQNVFAADREVGVVFYNCTADQNLSWATGIFFDNINDTVKTRVDHEQGFRASGRVNWLPYYDEPSQGRYLVHTGLGVLYTDDNDDRVQFRARPQVQRGPILIDSGILNAGNNITANTEFAVVWGPVTLQSEAFACRIHFQNFRQPPATIGGAYAHLSYFVTGENRVYERFGQHGAQFGRNRPFNNFFAVPGGVGPGAIELKARWSYLDLNSLDKGQYNDMTVGFNWYWSDRTRIMFDWIHPLTTKDTVFGSTNSDLIGMRVDFNW